MTLSETALKQLKELIEKTDEPSDIVYLRASPNDSMEYFLTKSIRSLTGQSIEDFWTLGLKQPKSSWKDVRLTQVSSVEESAGNTIQLTLTFQVQDLEKLKP